MGQRGCSSTCVERVPEQDWVVFCGIEVPETMKWRLCQAREGTGECTSAQPAHKHARATGWRMNLIRYDWTAFNHRARKIELIFPCIRVICCRNHQRWRCSLVSLRMRDIIEVFDFFFLFPYPCRHWASHLNSGLFQLQNGWSCFVSCPYCSKKPGLGVHLFCIRMHRI